MTDAYLQDITPEFEASLTEEDKTFETTVMISLEALGVLESLKEASEVSCDDYFNYDLEELVLLFRLISLSRVAITIFLEEVMTCPAVVC